MNETVLITIPVSPSAAELLRDDPQRREVVGRLISRMVRPGLPDEDPLIAFLNALPRRPDLPVMTEEEIEAEIDAARAARCT